MFVALLKETPKKAAQKTAQNLYVQALKQTRRSEFYTDYGVPDTFDGRFDLLLVHIFLILNRLMKTPGYDDLTQGLFDATFRDMDQTLREVGIGDMGVPKHMRRMMQAFNGRMHAYQFALEPDSLEGIEIEGLSKTSLEEALRRNLYATAKDINPVYLQKMKSYIHNNKTKQLIGSDHHLMFVDP